MKRALPTSLSRRPTSGPSSLGFTAKQTKAAMPLIMAYRQAMKRANKFVLDKEFVEYATHISSNTHARETVGAHRLRHAALRDNVDRVRSDGASARDAGAPWSDKPCRTASRRAWAC